MLAEDHPSIILEREMLPGQKFTDREELSKELLAKNPLVAERARYLGPTYTHFYKNPLHLVKGFILLYFRS